MAVTGLLQEVRATLPASPDPGHRRDPGHRHRGTAAARRLRPRVPSSWAALQAVLGLLTSCFLHHVGPRSLGSSRLSSALCSGRWGTGEGSGHTQPAVVLCFKESRKPKKKPSFNFLARETSDSPANST